MMELIGTLLLLLSFALMFFCFYGLWCNNVAYSQRLKIIDFIFEQSDYMPLLNKLHDVSYYDHVFTLMMFRDPHKLYEHPLDKAF